MSAPTLILFRRNLRTADNPALTAALTSAALSSAGRSGPAVALYVLDDAADGRPLGGALVAVSRAGTLAGATG